MVHLDDYKLHMMALEQDREAMMTRLTTTCDQCLMLDRDMKRANKMSKEPEEIQKRWLEHLEVRHNL